jgi:hypothetical protein
MSDVLLQTGLKSSFENLLSSRGDISGFETVIRL